MTDDDIVKQVYETLMTGGTMESDNATLDYYLNPNNQRSPYKEQAAKVSLNVLVFQDWKKHLVDAQQVVKNWRAE